tara:strand:- start:759 stop:1544 length:786 start_codon:yes stop_codon:yes gene_type:complete
MTDQVIDIDTALYFIATGRGNGIFTLRMRDGYDSHGDERTVHICNLSKDAQTALLKARSVIAQRGDNPCELLDTVEDLNRHKFQTWGECDPVRAANIKTAQKGVMPWGKYWGQQIELVPIEYFVNWMFYSNIDAPCADMAKEAIRQHVLLRRDEFMNVVDANKAAEEKRQAEIEAKRNKSNHVGNIKDRIDITATITFVKSIDTHFGVSLLTILENDNGDVFKYFGSVDLGDKGDKITIKATVKDHAEYDGVKQTVITRPK